MHSVFSDGAYTPSELARRVKEAGLSLFSLTDHDNMGGSEEAARAARALGLRFVRGWEVSSYEGGVKVHVLGYGCQNGREYEDFLKARFEGALVRAEKMVKMANDYLGLDVTMDEVESYRVRKNAPLHTMHVVSAFAQRLSRKKGAVYQELFDRGRPAFCADCRPTPLDAIDVIHRTGGIAVLAHPGRILDLDEADLRRYRETQDERVRNMLKAESDRRRVGLMEGLALAGIDGIECTYTTHTVKETEAFSDFARAHGLIMTGGSDFHFDGGRNVLGLPVFSADGELLERLLRLEGSV